MQTCTMRALPFQKETKKVAIPVVVCPAMNTRMWDHPITEEHLEKLRHWGFIIMDPVVKMLACNTLGKGAMENVDEIIKKVLSLA